MLYTYELTHVERILESVAFVRRFLQQRES